MQTALKHWLTRHNIGEPTGFGGLKVFPLFPLDPPAVTYRLAAAMLASDQAIVAEVPDAAGPWFRVLGLHNRSGQAILLREADLLSGGKQDRIVDQTCLVPPHETLVVPVSCVEQGRSHGGGGFKYAQSSAPSDLRRMRMERLAIDANATQGSTWEFVAQSRTRRGLGDPSGSLNEVERVDGHLIEEYAAALPSVRGAAGVVIASSALRSAGRRGAIGVESVELFADPESCALAWPALVRAAASRLPGSAETPRLSRTEVRKFFTVLDGARATSAPMLGLGELARLHWARGNGTVLSVGGRLAHAALLAA